MKITGKGNYSGEVDKTFEIVARAINKEEVSLEKESYIYAGSQITPEVVVKVNGKTLIKETDYDITYKDNNNIGEASVVVTGKGDYSGQIIKTFKILGEIKDSYVSLAKNEYTYKGTGIKAELEVKVNNVALKEGTDYTTSYENNVNVGLATLTLKGIGNYTGEVTKTFTIKPLELADENVSMEKSSYEYTGNEIKPVVVVNGSTLKEGTDYTVSYKNNIDIGEGTVTVEGTGNCSGAVYKTFNITSKELASQNISLNETEYIYSGSKITPEVVVIINGKTLTNGTDYYVSYGNNINAGEGTVTVIGKAKYKGKVTKAFKINPVKITINNVVVQGIRDRVYTGKNIVQNITMKYRGKTVSFTPTYYFNKNVGIAVVILKGNGNYSGTVARTFKINKVNNPLVVKARAKTVKYKKVKKKKQVVKAITVSKNQGKVTYTKIRGSKKFTINKNNGKITVKKGTKKGTYKIKVKVLANGNGTYKSGYKTIIVKIRVK